MNQSDDRPLLIISRDALLEALQKAGPGPVFRLLAGLGRKGHRIILTAPEPERWVPTRRNVDQVLVEQQSLIKSARTAGGDIDGIYYVPRSLLTQDRNRREALEDILKRYRIPAGSAILLSASAPFLRAAHRLGIESREIALPEKPGRALLAELEDLLQV